MKRTLDYVERTFVWLLLSGFCLFFRVPQAIAVVGQAEKYDEFDEAALRDFQEGLLREEIASDAKKMKEINDFVKETKGTKAGDKETQKVDEELEKLRLELLTLPKRDRFQMELNGKYKYSSNVLRAPLRKEKGDSVFNTRGGILIDLSGKKTDFRWLIEGGKEWNIKFDENDTHEIGSSLNYRRKYYKKVEHSLQYRLNRHNSKTIEINKDKVRWDFGSVSAYNYPVAKKISVNNGLSASKRLFPQEAFDQDSSWEATWSPAVFWNLSPKSRLNAGYTFGANRIRSKTGDANSHEIHLGYFGRVTRKSSTSMDLIYRHQIPRSTDTPTVNAFSAGVGYIWQWTPKTQLTVQLLRSLQNSTSEIVSGSVDGENVTEKTDVYFTNDSVSFSLNSRLTKKLGAKIGVNTSIFHNKTSKRGNFANVPDLEDTEITQFTFPIDVGLTYNIHRRAALNLGYTFSYRGGYEKDDNMRVHELNSSFHLTI